MTTLETTYKVELTAAEIETITTALHGEYKHIRAEIADITRDDAARRIPHMKAAQELRNDFAGIIGRRYMGEDA